MSMGAVIAAIDFVDLFLTDSGETFERRPLENLVSRQQCAQARGGPPLDLIVEHMCVILR